MDTVDVCVHLQDRTSKCLICHSLLSCPWKSRDMRESQSPLAPLARTCRSELGKVYQESGLVHEDRWNHKHLDNSFIFKILCIWCLMFFILWDLPWAFYTKWPHYFLLEPYRGGSIRRQWNRGLYVWLFPYSKGERRSYPVLGLRLNICWTCNNVMKMLACSFPGLQPRIAFWLLIYWIYTTSQPTESIRASL